LGPVVGRWSLVVGEAPCLEHRETWGTPWLRRIRLETCATRPAYGPYGESYATTGTDLNFTGQNQDTVPGTYDFLYREYHPGQGRWISPDPAGLAAVDPANPQTWNRYAYVLNSPLNLIDPLGLRYAWMADCLYEFLDYAVDGVYQGTEKYLIYCNSPRDTDGGPGDVWDAAHERHSANNATSPCKGWGFGGTIGANGEIGGGDTIAAGATGSLSFGVFNNAFGQPGGSSLGATASGGAFVGTGRTAAPKQDLISPAAAALYAGAGAGLFITNAGAPGALGGHFKTYTVDTPIASVQFSTGGGIWSLSVTTGPGALFGASVMTTNTATGTVAGSGTCVGTP
jgi:RHS repeat-associated protein